MRPPRVAILALGREWDNEDKASALDTIGRIPYSPDIQQFGPVFTEADTIDALSSIHEFAPDLVILHSLHGSIARVMTLAGVKCGVPVAIWCHDERHALASSSLASESLRQIGCKHELVHGFGREAADRLGVAARAALAIRAVSQARIGRVGPLHPNLIAADVNPLTMLRRFGSWVVPITLRELEEEMKMVDPDEAKEFVESLKSKFNVTMPAKPLKQAAAIHLALKSIARELRLDAIAVDCWSEMVGRFGVSACLGFADNEFVPACEGDIILALTLIAGESLCGKTGYVGDFYAFNPDDRTVTLMHCGGSSSLHSGAEPMEIASQQPPGPIGTCGVVASCRPILPEGSGTIVLLHGEQLEKLHLRSCTILGTSFEKQMCALAQIEGDAEVFVREASGNHYVVFPGCRQEMWQLWAEWSGVATH